MVFTSGNVATVQFVTDEANHGTGFAATWRAAVAPCQHHKLITFLVPKFGSYLVSSSLVVHFLKVTLNMEKSMVAKVIGELKSICRS